MGKLDSLFGKTLPSGISASVTKVQENLQKGNGRLGQEDERHSKFILAELETLLTMFPESPAFLGRAEYTIRRRRLSIRKPRYPDLAGLRDEVQRFSEQKELSNPRQKIRKLLKRYPAYPDLRALNAIQIYNDTQQSGLDSKKIKVVQGALREITRAMYNDGLSLFNINWFMKIYLRYLESLKDRYQNEFKSSRNHYQREIRTRAEELHRRHLQATVMLSVKNKLSGLTLLNAKLKGSVYILGNLSKEDVKAACIAIKSNDGTRKIGEGGKTANNIIYIIMTLNLLFARIPILDNLVKAYQRAIPDISKDIVLQKVMVNNMRRVTEFQLCMASGDRNKTHDVAKRMFLDCIEIIRQHLDHGLLTKQQEVDPFLKAAWIAKESQGLFKDDEYRKQLEISLKLLEIVLGRRVQVKGAYELAKQLQDEIHFIMIEKEWMK